MADPITWVTGLSAVAGIAGGVQDLRNSSAEADRLENEARLVDTQALQRDTIARDDLSLTLSSIRSSRAANGLSATSPNALLLMRESSRISAQDRQIRRADSSQQAANLRASASSTRRNGRQGLLTGIVRGGVSLAQGGLFANG